MSKAICIGDTVRCVDNSSRDDWARWYGDDAYAEDMLNKGKLYAVRDIAVMGDRTGFDVGVPTPWGDNHWSADRFEKSLLRLPTRARATALTITGNEGGGS